MKENSKKRSNSYNLLSLFTGAGALDHGFELTERFQTLACIEMQSLFCQTLLRNQKAGYLNGAAVINAPIGEISTSKVLMDHFGGEAPDGIIGGPPCESFSSMGKQAALSDSRGHLIFEFCDWVRELKPRFFLFENVPHLAYRHGGKILKRLMLNLKSSGYNVTWQILKASDYGASTIRKRLIVVGFKGGLEFKFPNPTHGNSGNSFGLARFKTAGEALQGLPAPFDSPEIFPTWHQRVKHTQPVIERFAKLRPGEQDKIRKRWRLSLDRPGPSLVAGNLHGIRSHIHPTEPRELTNRESIIQGFPDNFQFCGNYAAVGKQVANSVPIPMAQALGKAIAEYLDHDSTR